MNIQFIDVKEKRMQNGTDSMKSLKDFIKKRSLIYISNFSDDQLPQAELQQGQLLQEIKRVSELTGYYSFE